jgi:hypothetical protein
MMRRLVFYVYAACCYVLAWGGLTILLFGILRAIGWALRA